MKAPFLSQALRTFENSLASVLLFCIALLPVVDVIARTFFRSGVYANAEYLRHLVLWFAFAGALITTREGRHLSMSLGSELLKEPFASRVRAVNGCAAAAVCTGLAVCSGAFAVTGFDDSLRIGVFPIRWVALIMPAGFAAITLRFVFAASGTAARILAATGVLLAIGAGFLPPEAARALFWPGVVLLGISGFSGLPVFALLGGLALLFFGASGGSIAVIANQAYTMLIEPIIPTIPLFTLAGFVLSESKAGERLVRFSEAWFGWMPGGTAIMAVVVCAFFTTFTGASGVTILALGGLLSVVLVRSGYGKSFSNGLLTSSGSLGLLFPPSIAIILYGVVAHCDIKRLFVAGIIPGMLMVITLAALGAGRSVAGRIALVAFRPGEAMRALGRASGEIALPVVVLVCFFSGFATIVESAAFAVLYVLVLEVAVHRDIALKNIPGVFLKAVPLVGGVLIILSAANAISYFMVDAEIPMQFAGWCSEHIHSKYLFLLLLNVALLAVGSVIEIYSSILIIVPLLAPLGAAFGIDPVHLGIIFIANMELGYLMPPVGLNLLLASYRFDEPLVRVYKSIVPFLIALFIAVMVITYVPPITTWLPGLVKF